MVKLKDIAEKAGVNVSTVSRALNDSSDINVETKNRIRKIAKEMNYVPNTSAQSLVGKGTKSIGVIVPEIISNYFTHMLVSIESELKKRGYSLIIGMTHHDYKNEIYYLNVMKNRKVDGIILAGSMYKELEDYLITMKKSNYIPMVLIQTFVHFPDYDYIMVDDYYGYCMAVEHLKNKGHQKIGFIADEISSKMRFPMYKKALAKYGLELDKEYTKIGKEMFELGGYLRMKELIQTSHIPSAVFASYDYIAIGAMKALKEYGLRVPDDISIIGYDDIREASYISKPLTTISPPLGEMAKVGVNLLLHKIEKDSNTIQHVSLKPELILRNTTAEIL